jgi:predicted TIM-barrel fold metal-dependent hydrolase
MRALAQQPHVYVKLSQLCFTREGWQTKGSQDEELVKSLVKETLDLFTPERCMFASNYPVDKLTTPIADMYERFLAWTEEWGLDEKAKDDLFYATAAKFYKFA